MKLKKLFAGILAVAMMATMAAPAFAAEGETTTKKPSDIENGGTFSVVKTFTDKSVEEMTALPTGVKAELEAQNHGYPAKKPAKVDDTKVAISVGEATLGTTASSFDIDLPQYEIPGEYVYYLKEKATGIAGVDDNNNDYRLTVYAIWDDATSANRQIVLKVKMDEGTLTDKTFVSTSTKIDAIDNTYKAGTVTVTKKVAGDFAREDSDFTFQIVLTSDKEVKSAVKVGDTDLTWTSANGVYTANAVFTLKADGVKTISNIPYGVSYAVSELDAANNNAVLNANTKFTVDEVEYTVTYDAKQSGTIGTTDSESNAVNSKYDTEIKNKTKGADVDTGVILDNAPYIALMMVVVAGAAVMIIKKRRHFED